MMKRKRRNGQARTKKFSGSLTFRPSTVEFVRIKIMCAKNKKKQLSNITMNPESTTKGTLSDYQWLQVSCPEECVGAANMRCKSLMSCVPRPFQKEANPSA